MRYVAALLVTISIAARAQGAPPRTAVHAPSAASIVDSALRRARREHKAVFITFGASFCSPCRALDAFLESKQAAVFRDHFVIVSLTIDESGDKAANNNPGGDSLAKALGAPPPIPFFAILDAAGRQIGPTDFATHDPIANMKRDVSAFAGVIERAAPTMRAADAQAAAKTMLAIAAQ